MEIGLGELHGIHRRNTEELFQSLFLWKSVWEKMEVRINRFIMIVSILVFMEIGLGALNSCLAVVSISLFQSLFLWKSVWEKCFYLFFVERHYVSILVFMEIGLGEILIYIIRAMVLSFNPCFYGNRSGS